MERAWTHFALVAATLLGVCAASRALPQEVLYGRDADAGTNRPALVNNGGALYLANPIGPAPAAPNACVDGGVVIVPKNGRSVVHDDIIYHQTPIPFTVRTIW